MPGFQKAVVRLDLRGVPQRTSGKGLGARGGSGGNGWRGYILIDPGAVFVIIWTS
jgi:hypothetical protein